jgi:hypothetical protein
MYIMVMKSEEEMWYQGRAHPGKLYANKRLGSCMHMCTKVLQLQVLIASFAQ